MRKKSVFKMKLHILRGPLHMRPVNRAGAVSEISPLLAGENSRPPAPSRETPLGPGAKKDGCYASPHFPS